MILINLSHTTQRIVNKERIAQLLVVPTFDHSDFGLSQLASLSVTRRGEAGFGSTGRL